MFEIAIYKFSLIKSRFVLLNPAANAFMTFISLILTMNLSTNFDFIYTISIIS